MVKKKVLLLLILGCVVLWPVVSFGADANTVKDLFAQAQAHLNDEDDENDDNDKRWLAAGDIYRQIAAADLGGDDGLKAQERIIWLYTRHEKPTQARTAYEYLMANFSENENLAATMQNELISAFRDSGDYKTTLEMYDYLMAQGADERKMLGISSGIVKCYIGLGYDANATAEVEVMLSRYANDQRLLATVYDLAYECRSQKKWGKSREFFQYFVANWPNHEQAMEAQRYVAKASIKLGDDAGADTQINNLIAAYANNPEIGNEVSQLAEDYTQKGNHEKAASLYALVAQRWPQSEWASLAQCQSARMYIEIGDYTNAAEAVEKLKNELSTSPGIVAALEDVGDKYELNYSSRESYDIYKYLLQNWPPDDRAVWIQMKATLSQIRLRDLDKANAELSNLLNDFAGNKELAAMVHEVVEEYRDAGYNEEGRSLFKYILENWTQDESTNLELQVGLALQSIKLDELDKAQTATDTLIADYNDHPNIAKGLFQIAEQHYYARNYQESIDILDLIQNNYADSVFPSREEVPFVLATCCKLSKQWDKAIANYKRTVEQYPTSRYASWSPFNIGWIYMHRKDNYDNAILWFGKQIELYPEDPYAAEALFQTECIYVHRIHDYEKGAETCLKYLENYPNELDAWPSRSNLARCYKNLGQTEKAFEVLDSLLEDTKKESLREYILKRIRDIEEGGAQ